jgi:ATP-binding cassette subfamily B (MDR/TAP) protein 1
VEFSYPTRPNKPVLQNFSLEIPTGKTVALVGPRCGVAGVKDKRDEC